MGNMGGLTVFKISDWFSTVPKPCYQSLSIYDDILTFNYVGKTFNPE